MFGWKKRQPAPTSHPTNPGVGPEARLELSDGRRTWTERIDVVALMAAACEQHGHSISRERTWLAHGESGFQILPQFLDWMPLEAGGVRTVTTVQVNHPTLVPQGVFEFQHSAGDSVEEAIGQGFSQWVQTDFVTLLEAGRAKPEHCMMMVMTLPPQDGRPELVRRAVLGPVAHLREREPDSSEAPGPDERDFCPCCLVTRSFEAFQGLFQEDAFYGLRLFAVRNPDGTTEADCRVNGEDWEPGAQALREYARTWPDGGFEFRKQYVVLQTLSKRPSEG